jgi:nitrogen regulatory protein P-II 1
VLEALYRTEVRGRSMSRIQGHGGELDRVESYRDTTVKMELSEKVRFEIGVSDHFVEPDGADDRGGRADGRGGRREGLRPPRRAGVRIRTGELDTAAVTPVR